MRIDNAAFAVQKVGQLISIYSGCSCNDYLSQNRDDVECGARKTGFHKQLLDEAGRLTMESLFHQVVPSASGIILFPKAKQQPGLLVLGFFPLSFQLVNDPGLFQSDGRVMRQLNEEL